MTAWPPALVIAMLRVVEEATVRVLTLSDRPVGQGSSKCPPTSPIPLSVLEPVAGSKSTCELRPSGRMRRSQVMLGAGGVQRWVGGTEPVTP
jgi:hypothetical protein